MAWRERADPVADERFAIGLRDQVQLVLVMEVPAVQFGWKPMTQTTHHASLFWRLIAQFGRARINVLKLRLDLSGKGKGALVHCIKLTHHIAAVNIQRLRCDVTGFRAGQKDCGTTNILRRPHITEGHGETDLFLFLTDRQVLILRE